MHILLKDTVMMKEHSQLLFIFTNFAIRIFCKIFAMIYFHEWCLLTLFAEF